MSEGQPRTERKLDPNAALGAVIKGLREEAGLSKMQLAARAGFDLDEVDAIETGRMDPTWGDLRRVAYALKVPLSMLMRLVESEEGVRD